MTHAFYITRAEYPALNESKMISREDWVAVASDDPDLREGSDVGFFAAQRLRADGAPAWFRWSEGNVYTEAPDRATLLKMIVLAERLGATVRDPEGRPYEDEADVAAAGL